MEEELRRVAGIVLGAPLTRRTRHELLYCFFGGLAGVAGFVVTVVLLTAGFTVSASIIGTVVGLLLLTVALRLSRRLGSLHRRLLRRCLGHQVEAPPKFQPGTGVLGRLDRRLRDRAAWRGVWYSLIKLPVAAVQLYAVTLTVFGLVDITYPVDWLLFRNHPAGTSLSPLVAVVPLPFVGSISVSSWLGTYLAALAGALCVVIAAWLARGINAADHALARRPARAEHHGRAGQRAGADQDAGGGGFGRGAAPGRAGPARRRPDAAGRAGHEPGHGPGEAG